MSTFNKISKITKFTFVAISVGILSVAIGSSLVANAQSTTNSSSNSVNSSENSNGNGGNFFGKMGKRMKDGFGMKNGGKMDRNMMNKISDKMNGKMSGKIQKEAEKYNIDANLVASVNDAQKAVSDAQTAVKTGRKDKVTNLTELETKATEARKTMVDSMKKLQSAVFDARIAEAKTLGVDANVIDKFTAAQKVQSENMDKMQALKNNPDTKISEIKTLKTQIKADYRTMKEAQKDLGDAVQSKSPASSQISQPNTPATPVVTN